MRARSREPPTGRARAGAEHGKGSGVSYLQAFVIAVVQGVTELFPVSSLGHSVLIPAWIGGSWQTMVTQSSQQSSETSFYLAYIVALHCATALALHALPRLSAALVHADPQAEAGNDHHAVLASNR